MRRLWTSEGSGGFTQSKEPIIVHLTSEKSFPGGPPTVWIIQSVCLQHNVPAREDVEPLCWATGEKRTIPRGGASRPDSGMNLRRLCMAAFAYTGPNCERPLFCSQWKAVMGRPQKRDPFVPHFVWMCVYTWVGWGWVGCIFGPNSEDLTVLPGETCRIPLIWGCVYVNNWCVNVCAATGLPTPWACFYIRERI